VATTLNGKGGALRGKFFERKILKIKKRIAGDFVGGRDPSYKEMRQSHPSQDFSRGRLT